MQNRKCAIGLWLFFALLAVLAVVLLPSLVQAAPADLPPRPPTATPTPVSGSGPASKAPPGALIVLNVPFDAAWPTSGLAWQDLWTVVQWRDQRGVWRDVEGWQGSLDKVADEVGYKSWWLPEDLWGRGPFRWVVYRSQGGSVMEMSENFYLPSYANATTIVAVDPLP